MLNLALRNAWTWKLESGRLNEKSTSTTRHVQRSFQVPNQFIGHRYNFCLIFPKSASEFFGVVKVLKSDTHAEEIGGFWPVTKLSSDCNMKWLPWCIRYLKERETCPRELQSPFSQPLMSQVFLELLKVAT